MTLITKSLFLVGACFVLFPSLAGADDAFGTANGSGYGASPGNATGTNSGPPKNNGQSATSPQSAANPPPAAIAPPVTSVPPKELLALKSSYESDMEAEKESPDMIKEIQEHYRDDLNELFHKEMVKGDESAALAVKMEMRRTLPGAPFLGRWAVRVNGFSVLHFTPNGRWTEDWDGHIGDGQWSVVNDKIIAVTRTDNYVWHYRLNEEGHLIRDDALEYAPEAAVHAYAAPAADGTIRLEADDADLVGSRICLEGDSPDDIGFWNNPSDSASWQVRVVKTGSYLVVFNYALDPGSKGSVAALSAGGDQATFYPPVTNGWDDFQTQGAGTIHLAAGPQEINLTALQKPGDGVLNLRYIVLVPMHH